MDLTDEQWNALEPLIGEMPRHEDGRGQPWRSSRDVLNGILWILRTGAQWADLPDRYPPYQICHRRFQRWVRRARWSAYSTPSPKTSRNGASWICPSVSSTAPSWRRKSKCLEGQGAV